MEHKRKCACCKNNAYSKSKYCIECLEKISEENTQPAKNYKVHKNWTYVD